MNPTNNWKRYCHYFCNCQEIGLSLDISRMNHDDAFFERMRQAMEKARADMKDLENGAIANPDEGRMVGHYWLRTPSLAPDDSIQRDIEETIMRIGDFASKIHNGEIIGQTGKPFVNLLIIGIGGSALGPQFVADALRSSRDRMKPYFLDNTDPDGFDRVFAQLAPELERTLTIVISKSGSTKETRNGMLEAMTVYRQAGLEFSRCAIAITGLGSDLDELAIDQKWLARFPMWDWVGGRTSITSAVGLLPAALQGIDTAALLRGASACDAITRTPDTPGNPAALMALMWFFAGNGKGERDLVMLPYKDRLLLFSRYLQQLLMESLGKELDRDGKAVNQGIVVYGNKGSTDQHAYMQQLRDGTDNFFVTFIQVLKSREGRSEDVEIGITSGDFLFGLFRGSRAALSEHGRQSMTITVENLDAFTIGALIALFERAVGFYASLINVNAYHQPGVEAGKKAAGTIIALQKEARECLAGLNSATTAGEIAAILGKAEQTEDIFEILRHLAANPQEGVKVHSQGSPERWKFSLEP